MKIIIFTVSGKIENSFSEIKKSKEYGVEILQPGKFKQEIRKALSGPLYFIDIASFDISDNIQLLKMLRRLGNQHCGIIDTNGVIGDVAELFHYGICEYIGKDLIKTIIPKKRIHRIFDFLEAKHPAIKEKVTENKCGEIYIPIENGWNDILTGREYTFCFMYIGLDGLKEFKSHFSREHIEEITGSFRNYIASMIAKINGKIWMWTDFEGLILLPFDGKKIDAILFSFELMINRMLMSVEHNFDRLITYRIALHLGNTEYKPRGETGKIVSESINAIFHLGQKYTKPGTFVLTENLFEFIPMGLDDCFFDDGSFEGRRIKKMVKVKG